MPELPEVETISKQLHKLIAGQRLQRVRVVDEKLRHFSPSLLTGRVLKAVRRSGKEVMLIFSDGRVLRVHLRMTGRLVWNSFGSVADSNKVLRRAGLPKELAAKHIRARFKFDSGELIFSDVRRFGTLEYLSSESEVRVPGLDPMSAEFTEKVLKELLGKSKQPIKVWLLRQDKLVGIGNIYASEILYRSGISPLRPASELTPRELNILFKEIRNVLNLAIKSAGTTFSDYLDGEGESGSFQKFLKVYARSGENCAGRKVTGRKGTGCKGTVERIVQAGRSTFYCKTCQS